MSDKFDEMAIVIKQELIATGVYSMWVKTDKIAKVAKPGQFISVYCKDGSRMLPRPISICEIDQEEDSLRIVYRTIGQGTQEFATYKAGNMVHIMGPLGNGFPLIQKKAFLIGGGIGIPPMLQLAKELDCEKQIVVGYRDELFLEEDLKQNGQLYIATEDGSIGTKGNVIDSIRENNLDAQVIYACGPTPMLKAVKEYAREHKIEAWLSLEEKMACGVGVCLACVCKSKEIDSHTNVNNKRVCKDGPVFLAEEVEFE
ncbi:MAG: dihydroorotate dehydrogenase electron transfer subunit [Lachnotalea sp.]